MEKQEEIWNGFAWTRCIFSPVTIVENNEQYQSDCNSAIDNRQISSEVKPFYPAVYSDSFCHFEDLG
jgi:hypothetical protein